MLRTEKYVELLAKFHEEEGSLDLKARTLREMELWEEFKVPLPTNERTTYHYQKYREEFQADICGSEGGMRKRFTLALLGPAIDPIWDRLVSKDLTITSAIRISDAAKEWCKKYDKTLEEAIPLALAAYDKLEDVVHVEGIKVRRGRIRLPSIKVEETVAPAAALTAPFRARSTDPDGEFWARISEELRLHIAAKLDAAHIVNGEDVMANFVTDLKISVQDVRSKIRRLIANQDRTNRANRIPQHQVYAACEYLRVPLPRHGEPVDLTLAARRRKELLRQYHSDTHAAEEVSPETAEYKRVLFERTQDAFDLLEQYNSQVPNGGNGERQRHA